MDESLESFLDEYGQPNERVPADEAVLSQLESKMPPILIEYWREIGFSVFKNGLLAVVNPLDWQDTLDGWLEDTELEELDDFIPILRGAFGDMRIFGLNRGLSLIVSPAIAKSHGNRRDEDYFRERGPAFKIRNIFGGSVPKPYDMKDEDGPMFERAAKKLGVLKANQIYGFVPMLPLGGKIRLENLQRVDAQVHLSILRGVSEPEVIWI